MRNYVKCNNIFYYCIFYVYISKFVAKYYYKVGQTLKKGGKLCLVERSRQIRLTKTQTLKQTEKQFLLQKKVPQSNSQKQVVAVGKSLVQQKPANS